jgi:hypothetical protein
VDEMQSERENRRLLLLSIYVFSLLIDFVDRHKLGRTKSKFVRILNKLQGGGGNQDKGVSEIYVLTPFTQLKLIKHCVEYFD